MRDWMNRIAGRANCSPALGVMALFIGAGVTIYIYHGVILETLLYAGIAVLIVAGTSLVVVGAINTLHWQQRRDRAAMSRAMALPLPDEDPADTMEGSVIDPDQAALEAAADRLADEGAELSWTPDGRTLEFKNRH